MRTSPEKRPEHILVVESENTTRNVLSGFLAGRGYRALAVGPEEAVPRFENGRPGAVILNVAGRTALDVLATFREIDRHVPIVVIADRQLFPILEQSAPSATLIARPFDGRELEAALASALKHRPAPPHGDERPASIDALLLGTSEKMRAVRALVERVADADVTVLVRGETGTGKELVARGLRWHSMRRDKPFVKVNCAALPADLLESELFGFERGAFTGAFQHKPGKFEFANHGTMFLDEIGDMSFPLQAKLLQVLQDGEFSRLGGKHDVRVDVRVVAATNRDIDKAVADGNFREDLFFRLNVVSITLPPLRERREEIPLLSDYFLKKYSVQYNKAHARLSEETLRLFMEHEWPGNVRELENLVKRVVLLGDEAPIRKDLMAAAATQRVVPPLAAIRPFSAPAPAPAASPAAMAAAAAEAGNYSLKEISRCAAREAERELILKMLTQTRWNRKETAEILGISYKALLYKIKESGLDKAS